MISKVLTRPDIRRKVDPIDYSKHGSNWVAQCTDFPEEQSPVNLSWDTATESKELQFELFYKYKLSNATVTVEGDGSMIRIDYPNKLDNNITVVNEKHED